MKNISIVDPINAFRSKSYRIKFWVTFIETFQCIIDWFIVCVSIQANFRKNWMGREVYHLFKTSAIREIIKINNTIKLILLRLNCNVMGCFNPVGVNKIRLSNGKIKSRHCLFIDELILIEDCQHSFTFFIFKDVALGCLSILYGDRFMSWDARFNKL